MLTIQSHPKFQREYGTADACASDTAGSQELLRDSHVANNIRIHFPSLDQCKVYMTRASIQRRFLDDMEWGIFRGTKPYWHCVLFMTPLVMAPTKDLVAVGAVRVIISLMNC